MRYIKMKLMFGVVAGLLTSMFANAAEYELKIHHFLGENSPVQKVLLEPWAQRVEQQSGGRINITIYPSMSLGGTPGELVDQVQSGKADIVWTVAGYTPGRFLRTEVFELPTVHFRSAYATNRAIVANYDLIKDDYKGMKPLLIHVNAGNALQMRSVDVQKPSDLSGLKLRTPSRTAGWFVEAMQGLEVAMPAPKIKPALVNGDIDGALIPFELFTSIGLDGEVGHSVLGSDGSRFGTSVFLFMMNENVFNDFPDELKAVIEANIGLELAKEMGVAWDDLEVPGKKGQYDKLTKLPIDQIYSFEEISEQVVQRWVAEAKKEGVDGQLLVDKARKYIARYSRIITTTLSSTY